MNLMDKLHGFTVREIRPLPEISAEMISMEYDKNGAQLIWLRRSDDNKTFSITFKTIPDDSTGVFHILEHSVLNGSEKYPVKEPFVELLKGSLQTFLNAFTFPDKTMYPVCSKNDKDFLGLIDVYLDAVLHPLSMRDRHAFLQEGHHLELTDKDSELTRNGVVFSEMKGAYSDPDTLIQYEINRLLFPDTCYGFDSGGHPEHIPELTYEKYKSCHEKFYHPSNSRIFLDGDMDIDSVLAKIDEYLAPYDRLDIDSSIPYQTPVSGRSTAYYSVTDPENIENKAILSEGWVYGRFDEQEKLLGCTAIAKLLCASNESPLTKALLEKKLCEDVSFQQLDGIQQLMSILVVHNANADKLDDIEGVIRDTLISQAECGLDHARLHSILTRMEFTARENDFAGYPTGLVFAMNAMDSWLYGGDPEFKLCVGDIYDRLHKKVDEGWFEELLRSVFIDNPHNATVHLLPSLTIAAENAERERNNLAAIKAKMSASETLSVIDTFKNLRERQNTPDTREKLDTLPKITVSDIPKTCKTVSPEVRKVDGVTVLHTPVPSSGITHITMMFSAPDIKQNELSDLSFFTSLFTSIGTKKHDLLSLRSELDSKLGRFSISSIAQSKVYDENSAIPYIFVYISLLDSQKSDAPELISEILHLTDFSAAKQAEDLLKQSRLGMQQAITQAGNGFGAMYLDSACTKYGVINDALSGIAKYKYLKETEKNFSDLWSEKSVKFDAWQSDLFSKNRVTLGIAGEYDEEFLRSLIGVLSDSPVGKDAEYTLWNGGNHGFIVPSDVGYASMSAYVPDIDAEFDGVSKVVSQLLTYDYLWNTVRVKGGAYGTGFTVKNGTIHMTSYRDPSPENTLSVFKAAADALISFCDSDDELEKYIISTVGGFDPLLSPRLEGLLSYIRWITDVTPEIRESVYKSILSADKASLRRFADVLRSFSDSANMCVVAGKPLIPDGFESEEI